MSLEPLQTETDESLLTESGETIILESSTEEFAVGTAGFKWTEDGTEHTHELGHPFTLEAAPALDRSRFSAQPLDKSALPTVLEVGSTAEVFTARIRFDAFPRRLLRVLDRGASTTPIDYYPDLSFGVVFPLLMRDLGELQGVEPDRDTFGGGEYERTLEVRSRDETAIWPLYEAIEFNGAGGGTPVVDGANQTGEFLTTAGWPASTTGVVLKGDVLRLGPEADALFVRALQDVDSDSAGDATIQLTIPIGSANAPADGATIHTSHPMFD